MGWEYEPETVWKAQELYCVDRLSFARVAELTGVSATTLKAWSDKYDWRAKREEIAQAESDIRVNTIKGRKVALEMLLEAGDGKEASQMAFAVASLESLALKQAELAAAGKIPSAAARPGPKSPRGRTPWLFYGTRWNKSWDLPLRTRPKSPRPLFRT